MSCFSIRLPCAAIAVACTSAAAQTVYVDVNATGAVTGASWCNAYRNLQDGIGAASASGGAVNEIRVANGVYYPDIGAGITPGDRTATFLMLSAVSIKGGYAGCGAGNPDARNIAVFETVLSGDLLDNDGANFTNYGDNSYHVVTYNNPLASGAELDGLTVRAGHSDGSGPAALVTNQGPAIHIRAGTAPCLAGGPTIRNCTVEDNLAHHHGAINDHGLATVIENCLIQNNRSNLEGGGLQVHSGAPMVIGCDFVNNMSLGEGGGAWLGSDNDATCSGPSTPQFIDCTFDGNSSSRGGGVMNRASSPSFENCDFIGNRADLPTDTIGAALYNVDGADVSIVGCYFVENEAGLYAGSVYNENSSPTMIDCVFDNNSAGLLAAGMLNFMNSSPRMHNCRFINHTTSYGPGIINDTFSSPLLTDCVFINNSASNGPGAVFNANGSSPTLVNCLILGNSATLGGAMHSNQSCQPTLINCVLSGNTSLGNAAGIGAYNNSVVHLINTTVANNSALGTGGALHISMGATAIVENSVLWNNSDATGSGEAAQFDAGVASITVNHSCVTGWSGTFGGEGNIGGNPLFSDDNGADNILGTEDDNLRPLAGSPVIDAGAAGYVPADVGDIDGDGDTTEPLPADLDGHPRAVPASVDMGAYERYDCNNNFVPDDVDIATGFSDDCNGNMIADECEDDCNNNSIADECESDSDDDGVIDDCDECPSDPNMTEAGECGCGVGDADSDGDSVPDCSDACPGFDDLVDSDGDGVADGCDLCEGYDDGLDCNHNSYPDPCEIMDGQVADDDGNGIPDPCDLKPLTQVHGSRYLAVSPLETGEPVALRISSPELTCFSSYIDADGALVAQPAFQTPDEWGWTIVHGAPIVPSTAYDFETEFQDGSRSAGARVVTWKWGDVLHDNVVNLADVQWCILIFQGNYPELLLAGDIEPCEPNAMVNILDAFMAVLSFQGAPYSSTTCPAVCPQ